MTCIDRYIPLSLSSCNVRSGVYNRSILGRTCNTKWRHPQVQDFMVAATEESPGWERHAVQWRAHDLYPLQLVAAAQTWRRVMEFMLGRLG